MKAVSFINTVLISLFTFHFLPRCITPMPIPHRNHHRRQVNAIAKQCIAGVRERAFDVCPTSCAEWRDLIRDKLTMGWNDNQIKNISLTNMRSRSGYSTYARPEWLIYIIHRSPSWQACYPFRAFQLEETWISGCRSACQKTQMRLRSASGGELKSLGDLMSAQPSETPHRFHRRHGFAGMDIVWIASWRCFSCYFSDCDGATRPGGIGQRAPDFILTTFDGQQLTSPSSKASRPGQFLAPGANL